MPNWCENRARLVAPTEAAAIAFEQAFMTGNLFQSLLPVALDDTPSAGGGLPNWYIDRCAAWGVKWDIDPETASIERQGAHLDCMFLTAWNEPNAFYRHLICTGWQVDAAYFEPSMLLGGCLRDGLDEKWDHDGSEAVTAESIPAYLYEAFGADAFVWLFDHADDCDCATCKGELTDG
jgi:hypothetical protein